MLSRGNNAIPSGLQATLLTSITRGVSILWLLFDNILKRKQPYIKLYRHIWRWTVISMKLLGLITYI